MLAPQQIQQLCLHVEKLKVSEIEIATLRKGGEEPLKHVMRKKHPDSNRATLAAYYKVLRAAAELAALVPDAHLDPEPQQPLQLQDNPLRQPVTARAAATRMSRIPVVTTAAAEVALQRSRSVSEALSNATLVPSAVNAHATALVIKVLVFGTRYFHVLAIIALLLMISTMTALVFDDPFAALHWLVWHSVTVVPRIFWAFGRLTANAVRAPSPSAIIEPLQANTSCTCTCTTSPAHPDISDGFTGHAALFCWMVWLLDVARARLSSGAGAAP